MFQPPCTAVIITEWAHIALKAKMHVHIWYDRGFSFGPGLELQPNILNPLI